MTVRVIERPERLIVRSTITKPRSFTPATVRKELSTKGRRVVAIADPVDAQDGATKAYADSVGAGAGAALAAHVAASDPHTGYQKESEKGAASGYASLDGSTKVPVAELPDATTSAKGVAELATSADTTAGLVVQASDTRLSDARTPTAHAASHQHGGSDQIATATPGANAIPKADGSNKLALGWISEVFAITDASDVAAKTGTGTTVVFATGPTLSAPVIGDLSNATHTHQNAAGGGTLDAAAIAAGTLAIARGGTNGATAAAGFDNLSPVTTRGDIIVRSATTNARLPIGTVGRVLRSDGTDPVWATLAITDLAAFTSAALLGVVSDETGSGALVFGTSPTLVTPTIASLTNAQHNHQNAAGGGSLDAAALGSGTLAAARMPAFTGDVTTSAGAVATTIVNDAVSDAKLRNSAALSVIGRSANSTGDPADIAAANDGEVLRRSGTTVGFGTVATAGIANDAVTYAKFQNASATDVMLARTSAGAGDWQEAPFSDLAQLLAALTTAIAHFNSISPLTTRGDLLTRDATNNARLAIGAAGRILQSNGTDPVWVVEKHDLTIGAANADFGGAVTVLPLLMHGTDSTQVGAPGVASRTLVEVRLFLLTLTASQNCDLNVYVGGASVGPLTFTTNASGGALTTATWSATGITATDLQSIGFDIQPTGGPTLNIAWATLVTIWRET